MGLGAFGGGEGVAAWLLEQDANVTITDLRDKSALAGPLDRLDTDRCRLVLGRHDEADFAHADLIIVNPAVPRPWQNPFLQVAREAGVPLSSEIRLLVERVDRTRCIGVTGTNGKSTTAAMTSHLLCTAGIDARLGGNIGGSLLCELNSINEDTWLVLELSSAQLYWLDQSPSWSPAIAGITNIAANHLDWHGDENHYRHCKEVVHRHQLENERCIRGETCPNYSGSLRLPGKHNLLNAAMAVSLAQSVDPTIDGSTLSSFRGLPHRLCPLGDTCPPRFFDDSKSTTPEATLLAVASFPEPARIHLIAGGYDKGVSLAPISALGGTLAGLYTIGDTGEMIARDAGDAAESCGTLDRAVHRAIERMSEGDVLLLSPGCASWDQFADFRERGMAFASLISSC